MADSAIGDLTQISSDLVSTDLFVLERDGSAMSVSGEQLSDFIDRNVLSVTITALASTASMTYSYDSDTGALTIGIPIGQGISAITLTSTSDLVDTYTVYRDDGEAVDTFTVTNGSSISSIERTSGDGSAGSTDVYTITLTNGNTSTFNVYNGSDGQGLVNSVNGIGPDSDLDVTITASDIATSDSSTVQAALDAIANPVVEVDSVGSFTATAGTANSVTLTHSKDGYTCYFMYLEEYRTAATWFIHVKQHGTGSVIIDYVNTSSTTYTVSSAKAYWLCIPN